MRLVPPRIEGDSAPRIQSVSLLRGALPIVACLVLLGICADAGAQNPEELKPEGYVNDYANVLSQSARDQLAGLCAQVEQKAQAQIAVVTVRSLNGRSASDYAFDLATRWGVGPKQKDRGVLILLGINDHKYWTEVGYGLEGILPDGKVGGFGREAVPLLRANNYDAAVLLMTRRVADVIAADRGVTLASEPEVTAPNERLTREDTKGIAAVIFIAIGLIILFRIVRRAMPGRRRHFGGGWWIGPMMGGWGGGGFGGGGWGGGSGGGSGGGFGGFGGGSFGGGGAGGSW